MRFASILLAIECLIIASATVGAQNTTLHPSITTSRPKNASSSPRTSHSIFKKGKIQIALKTPTRPAPTNYSNETRKNKENFALRLLELTNQERLKQGLMPLKRQETLTSIADWFAKDMANKKYLNHTDSEKRSAAERANDFKYEDWDALGENIASGHETPEEVFQGWMDSPGHKKNMLSEDFTEIGLGYATPEDSPYAYWVQEFGSRSDVYPLIIDLDEIETSKKETVLHLHGKAWAKEVRFRCDENAWTKWMPYCPCCTWSLCTETGTHKIQAELRRGDVVRNSEACISYKKISPSDKKSSASPSHNSSSK